jgi:hypothetical protein
MVNLPYVGTTFLRLNYGDITNNTCNEIMKFKSYRDYDVRKMWSSCGSTYCTSLA